MKQALLVTGWWWPFWSLDPGVHEAVQTNPVIHWNHTFLKLHPKPLWKKKSSLHECAWSTKNDVESLPGLVWCCFIPPWGEEEYQVVRQTWRQVFLRRPGDCVPLFLQTTGCNFCHSRVQNRKSSFEATKNTLNHHVSSTQTVPKYSYESVLPLLESSFIR